MSKFLLLSFFILAGTNHFWHPDFYLPLIPDYLPYRHGINKLSGALEIVFGTGLFFKKTQYYAALGIIILLIAFIPSHIHFIKIDACVPNGLCVPLWLAWLRLLVIHPLFMFWAWKHRK